MLGNGARTIEEHRGFARITQLLFVLFVVVELLVAITYWLLFDGNRVAAEPSSNAGIAAFGYYLIRVQALLVIVLPVVTMVWLYNAYKNLTIRSNRELKYKPYWAIIGFIVPIANLFIPIQIVSELYLSSGNAAETTANGASRNNRHTISVTVTCWWLLLLLAAAPVFVMNRILHMNTPIVGIAQSLILGTSAALMARIIARISLT